MQIQVDGKTVVLDKNDFLAQGGEGSVFVKNRTAFKIYTDTSKMIPVGKIKELSVLDNKNIIKPESVIYQTSVPVGYTMHYVRDTVALCQLFTRAFKERNSITPEMSMDLVKEMQALVDYIHLHSILIVDLNELNVLVTPDFKTPYFIDVDSFQTPGYHATALMESVRDRHNDKFTEGTDWFAFAIVTFQLLIGIHPYKGRYSKYKTLDERMLKNISVFHKDVGLPPSCYPTSVIPYEYRNWYIDVFEKGSRSMPPRDGKGLIVILPTKIVGGDKLKTILLYSAEAAITHYDNSFGHECICLKNGIVYDKRTRFDVTGKYWVGFYIGAPIVATVVNETLELTNCMFGKPIKIGQLNCDQIMAYSGRIYVKSDNKIVEIELLGDIFNPIAAPKLVGNVLSNATTLYPGLAIQNLLGAYYVSIFPSSGMCLQYKLDPLSGYRILDGKYDKGVLMLVGVKNGKYDRFVYVEEDNKMQVCAEVKDVTYSGCNFVVLDNGVCVSIDEKDKVVAFNKHTPSKVTEISDPSIRNGMRLYTDGAKVTAVEGNSLFSLNMV